MEALVKHPPIRDHRYRLEPPAQLVDLQYEEAVSERSRSFQMNDEGVACWPT